MNTIEERIRAAACAAASTVPPDGVPTLRLPAAGSTRQAQHWHMDPRSARPRWVGWLAPAATAVAIVAIVIAMVAVGQAVHRPGAIGPEPPAAGPSLSVPGTNQGPPVAAYVASGRVPPYYVVTDPSGNPAANPMDVVVRATVSGKALATIKPAAGSTIVAVTAAADDRTFVLGERPWAALTGEEATRAVTFFLVRLSASGQPGSPARLPMSVPTGQMLMGLALSPDGSKLAIAIHTGHAGTEPSMAEIKVYPLGAGSVMIWSGDGILGGSFVSRSLSWTDDQRTLAFDWQSNRATSVRLLNVASGGGSLLGDSRLASSLGSSAGPGGTVTLCPGQSIITPDGSAVVCGAASILHIGADGKPQARIWTGFPEFSTANGHLTRILGNWPSSQAGPEVMDVLWSDPQGRVLIGGIISGGHLYAGVISGHEFTPLAPLPNPAPRDLGTW